jgi:Calx-beta domain
MFMSNPLRDRRPTIRRSARSRRPLIEEMEGRQLLSSGSVMVLNSATLPLGTGQNTMDFTVWMSNPSTKTVTVAYNTFNQSAIAGPDYVATRGTLTFRPGQTSETIPVTIKNESSSQPVKLLGLQLSNPTNVTIVQGKAMGAILPPPSHAQLAINNVEMTRGYRGTKSMVFTVSLNEVLTKPVTVTATTSNGTARAGVDYVAKTQVVTIPPGQTTAPFAVTIKGTNEPTGQKFFLVTLSHASDPITTSIGAGILDYGA